ncbi:MAG: acetyl-CoA C-acetyltransferase [Thermodesulfobacteriota bacterium]
MEKVVIASAVRTAIGRFGGALKDVGDTDLGALVVGEATRRAGIKPEEVDETIMAHGYRTGELPINSARVMAVRGGMPIEKTQFTISKACGGSIRSVTLAAQIIKAGDADVICAGGVESMSRAAYLLRQARWGYRLGHGQLQDQLILFDPLSGDTMGETAENVARKYNVSREDQDAFGFVSQERTAKAVAEGRFKEQIVPVTIPQKKGDPIIFDTDEHPRPTTLDKLAKLPPAFREGGTVTAGSSSGMNDGAAALIVMRESVARAKGIKPLAGLVAYASAGVDPAYMGIGPIPATRAVLAKSGLSLDQIELVELNEAFASQSLVCIRELGLDPEKVNIYGGAIALGHPVSASGGVLLTKLIYAMRDRGARYGLATMCIGGGQGIAAILEREA